jgi:hypothetical protein
MRYGYWWIEALLGVALIVAPFVGKFTELYTRRRTRMSSWVPCSWCGPSWATGTWGR